MMIKNISRQWYFWPGISADIVQDWPKVGFITIICVLNALHTFPLEGSFLSLLTGPVILTSLYKMLPFTISNDMVTSSNGLCFFTLHHTMAMASSSPEAWYVSMCMLYCMPAWCTHQRPLPQYQCTLNPLGYHIGPWGMGGRCCLSDFVSYFPDHESPIYICSMGANYCPYSDWRYYLVRQLLMTCIMGDDPTLVIFLEYKNRWF